MGSSQSRRSGSRRHHNPVRRAGAREIIRTAAPELGQDNEAILGALGYRRERIADLAKRGVI